MHNDIVKSFRLTVVVFVGVFFLILATVAHAHHKSRVLGESTSASELVFPPVTSGPGYILPDSSFYFLDQAFQNVRLAFALSAQKKAEVRYQIAGERLAELRIMLSRNDPHGIDIALSNLTNEMDLAADHLSEAAASGNEVTELAKLLNDSIKTQRQILGTLENQTNGSLRFEFKAARTALKESKVEIEDELPEDELENEIADDLEEEIDEGIHEASESASGLSHAIDVLTKLASEAAVRSQTRREEALRHAIEVKNEALIKQEERLLKEEQKKHEELLDASEKAAEQARKTVEDAHETARKFEETKRITSEIKMESESGSSNSGESEDDDD